MSPHIARKNDRDDYETPEELIARLNEVFHFTHDMAATPSNVIRPVEFFPPDSLTIPWNMNGSLWCNPPFSNKEAFLHMGVNYRNHNRSTVFLVPGNARETEWWEKYALLADEIVNLTPRVNFCIDKVPVKGVPFSSCLLVYYPRLPGVMTSMPRESYWRWK